MLILGCLAFALFYLSDVNDAKLRCRYLMFCFPLGAVLLILSVVFQLDIAAVPVSGAFWRTVFWILFLFFASLLVYTFSFPFP